MKQQKKPAVEESASGAGSEAAVLADIVEWSKACPPWQRDALRRLCLQDELDGNDIAALTMLCKDGTAADALSAAHVKDAAASSVAVTLKSLHSAKHVNALADGETLTFDKIGVTVLYGDNGSGKSGYARILKRACRARSPRGETILPNIYGAGGGQPSATIEFTANGQFRSSDWVLNQPADGLLSSVSVFDSRTANVHVDQTNDVAYTPLPLRILASLAQACQDVKQKLAAEIKALEQQTPAVIAKPSCQPGTKVGKLMAGLSTAKPEDMTALAVLSEAETARLATLKTDLAADPARAARQLLAHKAKLDAAIVRIEQLMTAIADANIAVLRASFTALAAARKAAQAASTSLFAKEALPDIGSDVWRALWEAARNYSTVSAYPEKAFPVTEDGARCVLCLQELQPEAATRLTSFENFVKDESKRREAAAQQAYDGLLRTLEEANIPDAERDVLIALVENDLGNAALAAEIKTGIAGAVARLLHVREKHQDENEAAPPLPVLPVAQLRALSTDLQQRATGLQADGNSEERKKLVAERDELADREWLAGIKDDVIAEIARRKDIAVLQKAVKDTATNRVTAKSAEVAEALVTNALRAQFAKEVDRLGVAGLAIELRQEKTTQGVPLFRVSLIKKPQAKVGEVLSEGEHRCVALAAFLAEMATTDSRSGIVFDDPVSSLDHMHREAVAKRLAAEGKERQIVVFTHDISFLLLLNEECRGAGAHIAFRSINRGAESAGFCDPNPPPNAQPVEKVIESMGTHLENTKIQFERGKQADWYLTVRSLQEQLRTTWERAVEEALSPVIRRLANKVDTKGLFKLTVLTIEDCNTMRAASGRCSALLHSSSEALNKPLPKPDAIRAEIQALSDWVTDIRNRQDKVKVTETATVGGS
jgi:energy-coupling factor transporter ATP-binding protein EcfA2